MLLSKTEMPFASQLPPPAPAICLREPRESADPSADAGPAFTSADLAEIMQPGEIKVWRDFCPFYRSAFNHIVSYVHTAYFDGCCRSWTRQKTLITTNDPFARSDTCYQSVSWQITRKTFLFLCHHTFEKMFFFPRKHQFPSPFAKIICQTRQ